jgi:hypothetical protein
MNGNLRECLSSPWCFRITFILVALTAWAIYWYLKERRDYKVIDDKLFVRHGRFGSWINVEEHMKKDHKEE